MKLTSGKLKGEITSEIPVWDRAAFLLDNNFSQAQIHFVDILLDEAEQTIL
ncbi:MAG: hypothetical protein LBT24_02255 [Tannerella sp.]|nr:hypothetical protein [Tannerella sp.]